ncbi:hypothetical protein L9F63_014283, partial [Diploptera punctata]
ETRAEQVYVTWGGHILLTVSSLQSATVKEGAQMSFKPMKAHDSVDPSKCHKHVLGLSPPRQDADFQGYH